MIPSSMPRGSRSVASRLPQGAARLDRHVGRVHAQQRDAAQDEREHRRRELRAARVARRRDRRADPQRAQHVRAASPRRPCPPRPPSAPSRAAVPGAVTSSRVRNPAAPRSRRRSCSPGLPVAAQTSWPRAARIATAVDPTPPDAPVTSTGPSPGPQAALLERGDAHRGGEPGRADRHRVAGGQPVGQRHDPARRGSGRTPANPPWRAVPMS